MMTSQKTVNDTVDILKNLAEKNLYYYMFIIKFITDSQSKMKFINNL